MKTFADGYARNPGSRGEGTEGSTRPTLDHLVELTCLAIGRAGRKRALPIKSVDHDEALRFGQAVRR